jgi:hypothetical protein
LHYKSGATKAFTVLALIIYCHLAFGQYYTKGTLLYSNSLSVPPDTAGWIMEGPGEIDFIDGWMQMYSVKEAGHHVFWCSKNFPESFVAEWEVKNLHPEAGLCIVFFAARGLEGEDLFDSSLANRNGSFNDYIKGDINNYHISYYANGKDDPGREIANLRKNKGFYKVQSNEPGIPIHSTAIHKIKLLKFEGTIQLFIDERKVIDWIDKGLKYGPVLSSGKIGFRQMKWTRFAYRNFKVWECVKTAQ